MVIIPKRDQLKRDAVEDDSQVELKKPKLDVYVPDIDDDDLVNEPEVPDKIYLEQFWVRQSVF